MAEFGENKVDGVFGGIGFAGTEQKGQNGSSVDSGSNIVENAGTIRNKSLVKRGFWTKFKAYWLQEVDWNKEIKVELTPYQQKVEDEINEFLHQEITWEKVHDFLFQEISFSKNKEQA